MNLDHPDCCVACRSCELACSYHHLGLFQPSRASVSIERDADSGTITRRLWHASDEQRIACDLCVGETQRACEKYCARPTVRRIVQARLHDPALASEPQIEGKDDGSR